MLTDTQRHSHRQTGTWTQAVLDTDTQEHIQHTLPYMKTWTGPKYTWTNMHPESERDINRHTGTDSSWRHMNPSKRPLHPRLERDTDTAQRNMWTHIHGQTCTGTPKHPYIHTDLHTQTQIDTRTYTDNQRQRGTHRDRTHTQITDIRNSYAFWVLGWLRQLSV